MPFHLTRGLSRRFIGVAKWLQKSLWIVLPYSDIAGLDVLQAMGRSLIFLWHVLLGRSGAVRVCICWWKQLFSVGVLSQQCIVSGLFIGMVLALQGYNILGDFGSEQAVGQMVTDFVTFNWGRW